MFSTGFKVTITFCSFFKICYANCWFLYDNWFEVVIKNRAFIIMVGCYIVMVTSYRNWYFLTSIDDGQHDLNRHFCVFIDVNWLDESVKRFFDTSDVSWRFFDGFQNLKKMKNSFWPKLTKKKNTKMTIGVNLYQLLLTFAWPYHYLILSPFFLKELLYKNNFF